MRQTTQASPVSRQAARKAREANRGKYAPRQMITTVAPKVFHSVSDDALRMITRKVLDALKSPIAVPSEVVFAALREVRALAEKRPAS